MQYGAILADPPWKFEAYSANGLVRSAESHYVTTATEDLKTIPVKDWAAKDCAMFMWVVDSHMEQALELMNAWGFEYKTIAFVWVKTKLSEPDEPRIGMGLWTRKACEICLLGKRGKPPRLSGGVRQVIMEPRREHSRKPDETYSRIEQLVSGPYLEMFARQRRPGWDAWGNETKKFGLTVNPFD